MEILIQIKRQTCDRIDRSSTSYTAAIFEIKVPEIVSVSRQSYNTLMVLRE